MVRVERWQEEVACRVVELILEANGGRWPHSQPEWQRVAQRFDVQVCLVSRDVLTDPLLRRGILYLPDVAHRPHTIQRFCAHEMAEACLQWEGEPPYHYSPPSGGQERHRIACLVERKRQS